MSHATRPLRIALGADHGGFDLKEQLKPLLAARVADGRADRGIIIDGAGIGSAMAANKVAGGPLACLRARLVRAVRQGVCERGMKEG